MLVEIERNSMKLQEQSFGQGYRRQKNFHKSDDSVSNTSKLRDILDSKSRNKQSSTKVEEEFETLTNLLWTEIRNPSKELHSDMLSFLRFNRWNDIFPSNIKRRLVKWRSFESPAALPVTTSIFPSTKQLETDYSFQIYSVF